jgi:nicotinamide-nucleotide amidase
MTMPDTTKSFDTAQRIIQRAAASGEMIVLAESCTGGMISAALTDIAGSSTVVERGLVTYSNTAKKELLGVPEKTLAAFGAVSSETALAMAAGALDNARNATLALSVTGIAGPGGGSAEKPVGLVHFAIQRRGGAARTDQKIFSGDRQNIRQMAQIHGLNMIYQALD